ncbi:TonB-dependent receptor [Dysgonomonas sp. 520]|uniref:SusC/RagA family TonB-linked outer membrane protein n=1 Tax=Dysgonomonas sp. 520 TaxID=2302931 RepID=UPI0013D46D26|nr:TonB-dependent receptor [Dysgonomonas sp. 520]NDW09670.1 TonB-dependent receptor [Dysgonomonas sp. 520]
MKKLIYTFILFLFSVGLVAQNVSIKGKISDTRGEPIIGASIKLLDGKMIAVTDIDGLFKADVPSKPDLILTVSYMGYQSQNVKVAGKTELNIVLKEDAQKLDEIVVIGYGTQKRSSLTSSIETINSDDLLKVPITNIDQALAGQVAGMNAMSMSGDPSSGREANISIRGISKDPLLVIDGVPRFGTDTSNSETRLSDLNPDDIESISILKDAAASAVYGARAANGVVLVTTKRGKGNKKVKLNYRGQFNLQKATKLPEFLNAYEFAKLFNRAVENSPDATYTPYTDEQLEMIQTHSNPNVYGDNNLMDYLKDYGYSTTHTLSATGGGEDITYYISGGYVNTRGLYSGIGRDRYNYSMKLDAKLMKGLTLSVDMMGTRSEYKYTTSGALDAAYNFRPTQTLQFTDGHLASINSSNPLIGIKGLGGYTKNKGNLNTLSANLKYDFSGIKGLSTYLRATFDTNNSIIKTQKNPVALYTYDEKTGEISVDEKTIYPDATGTLTERDQNLDNRLLEAGINYNNTFAAKHNVSGMLVANYQETKSRYFSGINENMTSSYPEIIGTNISGKLNGDEFYTERASLIGRFTYGYDYRYFFEANFRVDGSTKFHPDNRWGFFPSASASWILSNEKFFKDWKQDAISNIKFRGSAGLLGDDGLVNEYSYLMGYIATSNDGYNIGGKYNQGIIMAVQELPNIETQWAKREDYNIAADLGFWDNRFGLTYEYYWRYETNMLQPVSSYNYPPSSGIGGRLPYQNFGKMKVWGWDLTFSHKNAIDKVKYNIDLTLSKFTDKWLDYGNESNQLENLRRKGKGRFMTWVYEAEGLFQSWEEIENLDYDQDGKGNTTLAPGDIRYKNQNPDEDKVIDEKDQIAVKSSNYPDLSIGLKLGVNYKGFFMNALFHGVTGYKKYINDIYTLESNSLQRFQKYHLEETWTEDNPNAKYPRIKFAPTTDNNRKASTLWIRECDFLRLKSLSIGYAMPTHIVKKLRLSSLSISLQGSNLFTISSLKDMDPESQRGYPIQRSYGASLSIGF